MLCLGEGLLTLPECNLCSSALEHEYKGGKHEGTRHNTTRIITEAVEISDHDATAGTLLMYSWVFVLLLRIKGGGGEGTVSPS